jgi:hypothetical protein
LNLKRAALLFIFLWCTSLANAQETQIFLSTQSGSPVRLNIDEDQIFWNYSIGIERSFLDRLSLGLSWRKLFNFAGATDYGQSFESTLYTASYNEDYRGSTIDIETKYFFQDSEDGMYMSSNFSYQHMTMEVTVSEVSNYYSNPYTAPISPGRFKSEFNVFPIGFKAGSRSSGETFVWDTYLGVVKNVGHDNIKRPNEAYLEYNDLNRYSFIFGFKMGIKL